MKDFGKVNFKIKRDGEYVHCDFIYVECSEKYHNDGYFYTVCAYCLSNNYVRSVTLTVDEYGVYNTPEEAFKIANLIQEAYPPYLSYDGDCLDDRRNFDINLAPEFSSDLIMELISNS